MEGKVLFVYGLQTKEFKAEDKIASMKPFLAKYGFEVVLVDYNHGKPTKEALEKYAAQVFKEAEKLKPLVAIVAHSMGGMVARYLIEVMGLSVPKLIILESPNLGIPQSLLFLPRLFGVPSDWQSTRSMLRNSRFFKRLNRQAASKTIYYNIGGFYYLMFPSIFSLPGVPTKLFLVSHSRLRENRRVLKYIAKILQS